MKQNQSSERGLFPPTDHVPSAEGHNELSSVYLMSKQANEHK